MVAFYLFTAGDKIEENYEISGKCQINRNLYLEGECLFNIWQENRAYGENVICFMATRRL